MESGNKFGTPKEIKKLLRPSVQGATSETRNSALHLTFRHPVIMKRRRAKNQLDFLASTGIIALANGSGKVCPTV